MKDIEDRLKEEYDKVEVPDYMFDTSRVFKRLEKEKNNTKKIAIASVASIIVILLIVLVIVLIPKESNYEKIDVPQKAEQNDITIAGKIDLDEKNDNAVDVFYNDLSVFEIEINKKEEAEFINGIPYTKIKAKVLNRYLGNSLDEIELYVPGGVFNVKELKEKVKLKDEDLIELSKYNDDDFIQVTYYNEIYIPIAEEGKTYITTLIEKEGKYFVYSNIKYGFKEYDPETNIVKDDMGDEQLDIDRYLESINI